MGLFGKKKTAGPTPMSYADAYAAAFGDTPSVPPYWTGWIPRLGIGEPGDRFLGEINDDLHLTIDGVDYGQLAEFSHAEVREALAAWGSPMKVVVRVTKAGSANDAMQIPQPTKTSSQNS